MPSTTKENGKTIEHGRQNGNYHPRRVGRPRTNTWTRSPVSRLRLGHRPSCGDRRHRFTIDRELATQAGLPRCLSDWSKREEEAVAMKPVGDADMRFLIEQKGVHSANRQRSEHAESTIFELLAGKRAQSLANRQAARYFQINRRRLLRPHDSFRRPFWSKLFQIETLRPIPYCVRKSPLVPQWGGWDAAGIKFACAAARSNPMELVY